MGINMELVPPLLPQQPPLFWDCFPVDVGTIDRPIYDFSTLIPVIGGPKKPIPINLPIFYFKKMCNDDNYNHTE
jgi:hypothetical protein